MAGNSAAVSDVYRTQSALKLGVQALKRLGFRNTDISTIRAAHPERSEPGKMPRTPLGAGAGASTGVVVGAIVGWMVGSGSLGLPGWGLLIAVGPIASALAGAGAVGAMGGMVGGIIGFGMDERDASHHPGTPLDDGIPASFHASDAASAGRAKEALEDAGVRSVPSTKKKTTELHESEHNDLP